MPNPARMSALVVLLLVLACQDNTAGPNPDSEAVAPQFKGAPPPANPEIAFSNDGIWVMNRDGSNAVRVSPRGRFNNPSWSSLGDGSAASPYRIAYDAGEVPPTRVLDVRIVNGTPTGGTPRLLAVDGKVPAWSPDGSEIAYVRSDTAIWITNPEGTSAYQVAKRDTAAIFTRVTWSGDGQRLAWIEDAEDYSGNPIRTIKSSTRSAPGSTTWSTPTALYVVGRTPGGLSSLTWANQGDSLLYALGNFRRIALLDITGPPAVDTLFEGGRPVWSPDDKEILFVVLGVAYTLARYSLLSGSTTVINNKSDGGRADWRR
jgi:Tol biopolymer transport system component